MSTTKFEIIKVIHRHKSANSIDTN